MAGISIAPLQTFELRPTEIRSQGSWSSTSSTTKSSRILSVYGTENEKAGPKYYIDTAAVYSSPINILDTSQTVALFDGNTPLEHIVNRSIEPLESVIQMHARLGRFMCTVGSIYSEPIVHEQTSDSGTENIEWPQSCSLSSGLGHGSWHDRRSEVALGLSLAITEEVLGGPRRRLVNWHAAGSDKKVEWEGRGVVQGGTLTLCGRKLGEEIAVYKPRCAKFVEKAENGSEEGQGMAVLGVCQEKLGNDEETLRHVLLCAVAIEEQIMRSKGFNPRSYHGVWR